MKTKLSIGYRWPVVRVNSVRHAVIHSVGVLYFQNVGHFHGKVKGKVKFTLEQATKSQRGSRGIVLTYLLTYSFFNLDARWGGWSAPRSGRFTPGKETRYSLYRRLGGP